MKRANCVRAAWTAAEASSRGAIACLALGVLAMNTCADFLSVPAQHETIQDAVAVAQDGDTILVAAGSYNGPVRFHGKKITIRSLSGPIITSINSFGTAVQFIDGETLDSRIEGFTIEGINATYGGGVHIAESAGTVSGCIVLGSAVVRGGAINVQWGEADIVNTSFAGTAGQYGGGLCLYNASATLLNCSADGGSLRGGGIAVVDSSMTCALSGITGSAAAEGGGLFVTRSMLELSGTSVASCTAGSSGTLLGRGAGLCILDSPVPSIEQCSFEQNLVAAITQAEGGGIYSDNSLVLIDVSFALNLVLSGGELPDRTMTDGLAAGAAVYSASGACAMVDCVFYGNELATQPLAEAPDGVALGGSIKVSDDSIFQKTIFHDIYFLRGGRAIATLEARGGCIEAGSGDVTLIGCSLYDAHAFGVPSPEKEAPVYEGEASGGAIWTDGSVSIIDSTISSCIADGFPYSSGGGIHAPGGAEIIGSAIVGHLASNGGGMIPADPERPIGGGGLYAGTSTVTATNSSISGNACVNEGGGIRAGIITFTASTANSNVATTSGGGIHASNVTSIDSTVNFNAALMGTGGGIHGTTIEIDGGRYEGNGSVTGGAIYAEESAMARNTVISGNSALIDGGGIASPGPVSIQQVEAMGNQVSGLMSTRGGFVWSEESVSVEDSFIDGNSAIAGVQALGGAIGCAGSVTIRGSQLRKNIVNGLLGSGGAINTPAGVIEDCSFYLNQALAGTASGGAIAFDGMASLLVRNCDFQRDMVIGELAQGGSIFCSGGDIQIDSCTFLECSSSMNGGAMAVDGGETGGQIAINASILEANVADGSGGGLSILNIPIVDIRETTFMSNLAMNDGGGVNLEVQPDFSGAVQFEACAFDQNSSAEGGGLFLDAISSASVDLSRSAFSRNSAILGGGIRVLGGVELHCEAVTFCSNTPDTIDGEWIDLGGNSLFGEGADCNQNGTCDGYDIAAGGSVDCNANGIPDECDIASGSSDDANGNDVLDECEDDCNGNGISDQTEIKTGSAQDCNLNGMPDECDLAAGTSFDADGNSVPDECDPDCNANGLPDAMDIATGTSEDCNENLQPDECDLDGGGSSDQDANGVPDECECLGELDGDTLVDGADITVLLGAWGPAAPGEPADLNADGEVNGQDLFILLSNYGEC